MLLSESVAGVLAFVKDSLQTWKKSMSCKPSWGTFSKGRSSCAFELLLEDFPSFPRWGRKDYGVIE